MSITNRLFFFPSRRRHTRYWRDWSSDVCSSDLAPAHALGHVLGKRCHDADDAQVTPLQRRRQRLARKVLGPPAGQPRSEEHTSELQSRQYLVCRLLLEKKKRLRTPSTLFWNLEC